MFSYDDDIPFTFFTNSLIDDIAHQENSINNNSLDPFSLSFFSFSPSTQSLCHEANHVHALPNSPNLESEFTNFSALDGSRLKSEEHQHHVPDRGNSSNSGAESASEVMQRSSSCNSFDGNPAFPFEPHCHTLMDSPNFQWHALSSSENSFFAAQLRRVFSAGDLQNTKGTLASQNESTLWEEVNFKVGRYSAEARKEKISKYRAKRSQRKFNKTIKYECRKTLADNRARIRGRFARNDDTSVIPEAPCSTRGEDGDEFWIDLIEGLNAEILSSSTSVV